MKDEPLYVFPPKLSRTEKQAKALNDLAEHRKMSKQMYRNLILAGVIFALSLFVKFIVIKILLILLSLNPDGEWVLLLYLRRTMNQN